MHRLILFIVLFSLFQIGISEGLRIITSHGLQGVANMNGEVVIPPVYEHLGWSNGQDNILSESIGYLENGKWGLINIKNKKITNARYSVLKPFREDVIEAGITGKFSNMIFRGLIDVSARTLLDFRYFSIEDVGDHRLIVSEYADSQFKYGLYTDANERVIPVEYASVTRLDDLILVTNKLKKIRIFDLNGNQLINEWVDEVSTEERGFIVRNEGFFGLLSKEGKEIYPIHYKGISKNGNVDFPKWEVVSLKDDSQQSIACDSIIYYQKNDLLIAHINNIEHILGVSSALFENQQHQLKYLGNGFLVTKNAALDEWGIYKTNGAKVVSGFDSVFVDSVYFYTKSKNSWGIYNLFGQKLNQWPFQEIGLSQDGNIPIKKNDYWGWIDFQGKRIIDNKFDAIITSRNKGHFIANYLAKWGVNTFDDHWVILPEYDSIYAFGSIYIGEKGHSKHILSLKGKPMDKTTYQLELDGFLKIVDGKKFGAITEKGFIIEPVFDSVMLIDNYLKLRGGEYVTLIDQDGRVIVELTDEVEDIFAYSEGFFHILKDNKHGFVDENGKLRVANRYDGALPYSEGLAPVKLMGKWGFINKAEKLTIQPFYENSSTFRDDLAIVQIGENYGIINKEGEKIIKPAWKKIKRLSTGNYLITDWSGKKGLANKNGRFVLRPAYDDIKDTSQRLLIATKGDKKGVLDYSGYTKVDFEYENIQIQGDYMLLLKGKH